jgi:hypothetical protein
MNRRTFIQTTGTAATLCCLTSTKPWGQAATEPELKQEAIPPHRPIQIPGLHAYSEKSLRAGDRLNLRVSSTEPYEVEICRLGEMDRPETDEVLARIDNKTPEPRVIHPGSYVHIEDGLPTDKPILSFAIECWVRLWKTKGWQGLVTQHDYPHHCGYGLFLSDGGQVKSLWINGHRAGRWRVSSKSFAGRSPLRLGAYGHNGIAVNFLDGDIAAPAIYNRNLTPTEIRMQFARAGTTSNFRLEATTARLRGPSVRLNSVTGAIAYWTGPQDRAIWRVRGMKKGIYEVFLGHGSDALQKSSEFEIHINEAAALTVRLPAQNQPVGRLHVDGGDVSISLHPKQFTGSNFAEIKEVELVAIGDPQPMKPLSGALAYWPLDEEKGDRIRDISGNGHHGRIINQATWMIGGPGFDARRVPRFKPYDPSKDSRRGHGLRFASDDLYDCRWPVTHTFDLPADSKPGLYCVRFRYKHKGEPRWYHSTFLVRSRPRSKKPPILVLCSTGTWLAYNTIPFHAGVPDNHRWFAWPANSVEGAPTYSCYSNHAHGQPSYNIGLNLPWPSAGPEVMYSPAGVEYSHLMRGERFTHRWLESQGYEYDVAADHDLDANVDLLDGYQTVIINGHSEYWSTPAMRGLDRYLEKGGTAIVLSGNTMFWRTSYDRDHQVMECRKFDPRIGGRPGAAIGEIWHSQDGRRGSIIRECGFPEWEVIGQGTLGYWGVTASNFGVFKAVAPDHFLFKGPEPVELQPGDTFGHGPKGALPRAIGHEADGRLSTLIRMTRQPLPEGYSLPEEPSGIITLAQGIRAPADGMILDLFAQKTPALENVCAEMIYWKRPQGGRVFNAGAIGTGWALQADPKWAALLRNVLHHFGVERTQK